MLTEAALGAPELSAIHPFGNMPVLRHGAVELFVPGTPEGGPNRPAFEAVMPALRRQVAVLDQAVARTGYLVGDAFALAAAPHLDLHYSRHAARPSFIRTETASRRTAPDQRS